MLKENLIGCAHQIVPERLHEWPVWVTDIFIAGAKEYDRALIMRVPPCFES
jgi:hypothetical protein